MANNKYQIAIEALREREQELNKELESLRITINSLLSSSSLSGTLFDNSQISNNENKKSVNSNKSNSNKKSLKLDFNIKDAVLEVIKNKGKFMHFREIAESIIKSKSLDIDATKLARELSIKTLSLKKKGVIVKFQFGNEARNTFWGKPEWLHRNGGIIKGYEYDTNYISDNLNPKNYSEVELYG